MEWIKGASPISFPGLGFTIDPPAGFSIGSFEVMFYGVIIALGLTLCCIYGLRRGKDFGLTQDDILDGVLWIVPFAFVCARLYYCAFFWEEGGYGADLKRILYVWEGGLAIYGGVIGATIGIFVYCLAKKIPIGRWGNFFNREAFGNQTESFLRMGLKLTEDGHAASEMFYYHPTFLYESLWNALGFVLLHYLSKKRKYEGQMALCYVLWYGLGRTFIEGLRTDSLYWGPFRVSQLLAAVSAIAAAWILVWLMFRPHDPAKLYVNRVAAKKAAEAAVIDETAEEETHEEEN